MGSALTVPLTDRWHAVALWCTDHDEAIYHALSAGEAHPKLETRLPESVRIFKSSQIDEAMAGSKLLILGVSTPGVLPVLRQAAPYLRSSTPILTVAKGFLSDEAATEPVPSGIQRQLEDLCPELKPAVLSMTGPSIAEELVRRQPTAAAVAGEIKSLANGVCERLATDYFWLDPVQDLPGLEICLAYKNIYSIALAWPEGLDQSAGRASAQNLSAILLLQAVSELRKLIDACHGDPDTANGWSGLGDLVATSGGGRNGRFGQLLATGKSPGEAAATLEEEGTTTIEGRSAAPHGFNYAAQELGDDWAKRLPLLHAIQQVLEERNTVGEVIAQIHSFRDNQSTAMPSDLKGES